jgi:hypothetical protein
MRYSLDTFGDVESTVESSVIALGIGDYEFTLLLYQEVWATSVITQLERADDERLVSKELIASL